MTIDVIYEGDKSKQGNAKCPQCGGVVLISQHFGDIPKCPYCNVPYDPKPNTIKFD